MDTDRNLLFGVLALQADLIDAQQFADVCAGWSTQKERALADLLVERGWLTPSDRADVERLVERKLKKHGGDIRASLADAGAGIQHTLTDLGNRELWRTLAPARPTYPGLLVVPTADVPEARDRYALARLHATGGLGRVWLARDASVGRDVALKELRPERVGDPVLWTRFLTEARITGQLEHPGIVPVYEVARRPEDGQPFYTMRFVRGRTLGQAISTYHQRRRRGDAEPLELRDLLNAFAGVCNAVAYAHARGVIHRDLKPQNVVLGDYGEVIVLDWGLAKVLGSEAPSGDPAAATVAPPPALEPGAAPDQTLQGQVLGTPAYMAPEQAEGRLELIDRRTDVYGLGAILYELLTDQPPFSKGTADVVLQNVIHQPPIPPRRLVADVPPPLEAVCLRALNKKPADRYQSVKELATEVQHWLADEPVSAWPEPWTVRAGRRARRHKTLVATAAALLLATVVALSVGIVLLRSEQARTEAARQEASEHFRRSRNVVDRMLVGFADAPEGLRDAPGMSALRAQILEEAFAYYQGFLEKDSADPDVRQEAGRAFMLVARARRKDGKDAEAEQAFQRAKTLFAGLAGEFPDNRSYRLDLARCLTFLASHLQSLRRLDAAREQYRQAVAVCTRLTGEVADDPAARFQLAATRLSLGVALREAGDADAAEAEYRQALALAQELAARPGATPEQRAAVGHLRNNLGNLCGDHTRWADALVELEAAIAVWQPLIDEFPTDPEYRSNLSAAKGNLINCLRELGRKDDALKAADASLELRQQLAADFPTIPGYQAALATAHYNRGVAFRDSGRPALAEEPMRLAVAGYDKLVRALPGRPEYRDKQIMFLGALADVHNRLERTREAEDERRRVLELAQALARDYPSVRAYLARLADSHNSLGTFFTDHNRNAEGEEQYNEAQTVWRALIKETPSEPVYHSDLGMCLGNISVHYRRRDDLVGSRRVLDEALASHDRALALEPGHALYRKNALLDNWRLADIALLQGDHAAAVAAGEKALDLSAKPVEDFYNHAVCCSQAIARAEKDAALSRARRAEVIHAYVDRAVACLREVKKSKPLIHVGATIDKDMEPLRRHVDLKIAVGGSSPGGKEKEW
jgi:serine/threonine-protein kinase